MYKNLNHLSKKELKNFIQEYYSSNSVKDLIKKYQLDISVSMIYKLLPPKIISDDLCEYCKTPLLEERLSKTNYISYGNNLSYRKNHRYCPKCHHYPYKNNCNCSHCQEKRAFELKQQQLNEKKKQEKYLSIIQKQFAYDRTEPINFNTLPFKQKIYLGTICNALLEENTYNISSLNDMSNIILTPSLDFTYKIYKMLLHDNIIKISPLSPINAFIFNEKNNTIEQTYIDTAYYYLNTNYTENNTDIIQEILEPQYFNIDKNFDEALSLWKEIALMECIQYLKYKLREIKFDFTPGEKTHKIFSTILNNFSVSQMYGIIKKSVDSASNYYLQGNINKKHAANSVIGSCERFAEKAKINNWDLYKYNRLYDLPESTLSFFFFYKVLKIGNNGFYLPPTSEVLSNLLNKQ